MDDPMNRYMMGINYLVRLNVDKKQVFIGIERMGLSRFLLVGCLLLRLVLISVTRNLWTTLNIGDSQVAQW